MDVLQIPPLADLPRKERVLLEEEFETENEDRPIRPSHQDPVSTTPTPQSALRPLPKPPLSLLPPESVVRLFQVLRLELRSDVRRRLPSKQPVLFLEDSE